MGDGASQKPSTKESRRRTTCHHVPDTRNEFRFEQMGLGYFAGPLFGFRRASLVAVSGLRLVSMPNCN